MLKDVLNIFYKKATTRLHPDQIQIDNQHIDGIDRSYQHIQSLHGPIPLPRLTFHSVKLSSFDL